MRKSFIAENPPVLWFLLALLVLQGLAGNPLPPTPQEISDANGNQIFGVVGSSQFPWVWGFADSLVLQLAMVVLVPGVLALVFGWLALRSRVTGVYLSTLTQAGTLALALCLFQNDSGLRGNNGLSGLQMIPGGGEMAIGLVEQNADFAWRFADRFVLKTRGAVTRDAAKGDYSQTMLVADPAL